MFLLSSRWACFRTSNLWGILDAAKITTQQQRYNIMNNLLSSKIQEVFGKNKKARSTDTSYIMARSRKHHATWKKPERKVTCCMIPCIWNVQQSQIHRGRKYISGCKGMGEWVHGNRGWWVLGFLGRNKNILEFTEVMVAQLCKPWIT